VADLEAMNAEIRARARDLVAELRHDDAADNMPDTLTRVAVTPAIFVLVRRVDARELTPGSKGQKVDLEVLVGVVTQSLAGASAAMQGAKGSESISAAVIAALHWWKPSGALEKLKYRGEAGDPMREGSRLGVQHRFTASMHETY
jgi:hypothetical protein